MTEHDQAPEQCSQRRRLRAFEPAPVFGTTTVTTLIFRFLTKRTHCIRCNKQLAFTVCPPYLSFKSF
jgi:hypothetical protein